MNTAIRAVMDAQVAAWNHHDLEGFMAGYWKSPDLTFFSGRLLRLRAGSRPWSVTGAATRAEGHAMGTLSFSDLQIESLGADAAIRARQVSAGDAGRQAAARGFYAHLPQVSRGLADRSRSHLLGVEEALGGRKFTAENQTGARRRVYNSLVSPPEITFRCDEATGGIRNAELHWR